LKERTMVNSRRRVQLFGFPVELPGEQEVPGFHVWPPEEEVPGFRMNSDGSVRLPTERKSSVTDYAWPSVMAELTQPPLQPKVGPQPGIKMEVAPEPPPPPARRAERIFRMAPRPRPRTRQALANKVGRTIGVGAIRFYE